MTSTWWIALHTALLALVAGAVVSQPQLLQGVLQVHRRSSALMSLALLGLTVVSGCWAGMMVDRWPLGVWRAEMWALPRATQCGPMAYWLAWRECRALDQTRDATIAGYADHDLQVVEHQLRTLYPGIEHEACNGSDCLRAKAPLSDAKVQAFVRQFHDAMQQNGAYERYYHEQVFVPELWKVLYAHFDNEAPFGKTLRLINFWIVMSLTILATTLVMGLAITYGFFVGIWCLGLGGIAWLYHLLVDVVRAI